MKKYEEIINQNPIYLNDFSNKIDVISNFEGIYITKDDYEATSSPYLNKSYWLQNKAKMKKIIKEWEGIDILFASYGCTYCSGDAWVLFEQDGKLYEVQGDHCSCYGLEGQWSPEEVCLEELENRLLNGTWGEDDWSDNNFKSELCDFIGVEFNKNM